MTRLTLAIFCSLLWNLRIDVSLGLYKNSGFHPCLPTVLCFVCSWREGQESAFSLGNRDDDWSSSLISKKHSWLETIWGQHLLAGLGESYLVSVELGQCTLGIKGSKDLVFVEHLCKRIWGWWRGGGSAGGFHGPSAQQSKGSLSRAAAPESSKRGKEGMGLMSTKQLSEGIPNSG